MGQLINQTAIITGGGTGIGFAIAKSFHEAGAYVVICGRRIEVLQEAQKQLSADGERILSIQGDICSEADVQNIVAETVAQTGRIDILVNNAAAMRFNHPPEETSLEAWKSVIDTNINGAFLCSREAGKVMIKQKSGRIINISSMSGAIVNKYVHGGSYEVSKAALTMMTKVFATEWAAHNIKVNGIAPGYYATDPNIEFFQDKQDLYQDILELIPLKKFGALPELANLALYLASPEIDYMTGSTITIDGGYTVW